MNQNAIQAAFAYKILLYCHYFEFRKKKHNDELHYISISAHLFICLFSLMTSVSNSLIITDDDLVVCNWFYEIFRLSIDLFGIFIIIFLLFHYRSWHRAEFNDIGQRARTFNYDRKLIYSLPYFTKALAQLCIVHLRIIISELSASCLSPNHESVHRPFDMRLLLFRRRSESRKCIRNMKNYLWSELLKIKTLIRHTVDHTFTFIFVAIIMLSIWKIKMYQRWTHNEIYWSKKFVIITWCFEMITKIQTDDHSSEIRRI